jgi:hypothetical protein
MFKKISAAALAFLVLAPSGVFADARMSLYKDLQPQAWSAEAVYSLSAVHAIDGYEDGTFRPLQNVTREAFVKLMVSAVRGKSDGAAVPLSDVQADRWSYPVIQTALQLHWCDFLLKNGKFQPEMPILREEVGAMAGIYLLERLPGSERKSWLDGEWRKEQAASPLADAGWVRADLAPYFFYAVKQGILEGDQTGFQPQSPLSRQEAAAIISRLINLETAKAELQATGFYAISSYGNLDKTRYLNQMILGWSHLDYSQPGAARLDTSTTEFKIPPGWNEVTEEAERDKVGTGLMVFADDTRQHVADFLRDPAAQTAFMNSLLSVVKDPQYGFSGVCLDFEELKDESLRPLYAEFLRQLKARLGDLRLTVAVPPSRYYAGYDMQEIGKTADEVILMAYDFTDQASRVPSAPLPLVAEAVEEALQSVPREKLVLGLSKQANQWVQGVGGTEYYEPSHDKVEDRLKQPGTSSVLDFPYFLDRITFTDSRGNHVIWYEDTRSLGRKLWLAKYYGLKGVSLWHMGNFTGSDWERIESR